MVELEETHSPSPPLSHQQPHSHPQPSRRHSVVSRGEDFPVKLSSIHQSASESSIPRASIGTPKAPPNKQHVRTVSHSSKSSNNSHYYCSVSLVSFNLR